MRRQKNYKQHTHKAQLNLCVFISDKMTKMKYVKAATRSLNVLLILATPVDKCSMSTTTSFDKDLNLASMCISCGGE